MKLLHDRSAASALYWRPGVEPSAAGLVKLWPTPPNAWTCQSTPASLSSLPSAITEPGSASGSSQPWKAITFALIGPASSSDGSNSPWKLATPAMSAPLRARSRAHWPPRGVNGFNEPATIVPTVSPRW